MANIRHMAIVVRDVKQASEFYQAVFDMAEMESGTSPNADFAYLSDGRLNLALLKYRSDKMAGVKNSGSFVGAHHIGIQVDNLKTAQDTAVQRGGEFHFNLGDEKKGNFESKYRDPNGMVFDISHGGWIGTPTQRVGDRPDNMPPQNRSGVAFLNHVGVAVPAPLKTAEFLERSFGFKRRGEAAPLTVSDGYVTIAVLQSASTDASPEAKAKDYIGPRFIGFTVPALDATVARIEENGGENLTQPPFLCSAGDERMFRDPDGVVVSVSQAGWRA